jgi:SAM-dependent methyltransferase
MNSEEFGLIAGQQLLRCEDLHYGYWDEGMDITLSNFLIAQQRHTEVLLQAIKKYLQSNDDLILDAGCGIGNTTRKFLSEGLRVDGLVPSEWMAEKARENIVNSNSSFKGTIYCTGFQDLDTQQLSEKFEMVFFSESYQYINLEEGFSKLSHILKDDGRVIIFDFFRKDDVEGKSPLGGGHSMREFYQCVEKHHYDIIEDEDLTTYLSPNLKLISELLSQRILPFGETLDTFLSSKYKIPYKMIKFFLRKNLEEFRFKYSEERNQENFEKYKSYRLIVLGKSSK